MPSWLFYPNDAGDCKIKAQLSVSLEIIWYFRAFDLELILQESILKNGQSFLIRHVFLGF